MKKLIFIILLISSPIVWSEEIKLSCDMNLVEKYSTGHTETKSIHEVINIYDSEYTKFISITPLSDQISGVSTKPIQNTISINNFSDTNKWDITNVLKTKSNEITVTIRIDRNLGKIWYSSSFNNSKVSIETSGIGDCEKVDFSNKKF
jgi:hypothetical protein